MNRPISFKYTAIFIIVAWILVFILVPNLLVVLISFLSRDASRFVAPPLTLSHYLSLFEPVYFKIFTKSVTYSFFSTLICLLVAYPFAWLISRADKAYRSVLLILVIIPFWTSSLIRTYALVILFKTNGVINAVLTALGVINEPLALMYTDKAVYAGLVYSLLPFMILPLYASMEKMDRRLIEAARDLGAGSFPIFIRIIWPLSLPGVVAGCIMVFLPAMGLFYIPDLLGGAKSMLIGNFIKNQFLTAGNWPFGSAAGVFLTLCMLVLMLLYFGVRKRMENASVEKGL
ncbi:MAG: spermidine/putrescine ABC transporter permease PotB [Pseudomonadota bacterium]